MEKPNDTFCLSPWVHTYLSPQTERRLCCASRENAQNFKQYIDTGAGTGKYIPITLDEHWNSEHMKSVRRRMLAGETLPECEVCNNKLLNTDVYRDYFWHMFKHRYEEAMTLTDETGHTDFKPISWDYRFSNLCNFKCRMCGDMLSSAWESEQRHHNMIDYTNTKNNWMIPEVKREIEKFQDTQIEKEFSDAVEEHRVEEVYWVGGEPLMYEQHWKYMRRIVELGDGPKVYARYNTNLSRVNYKGINLYDDILAHIRDWQICASLDGTGKIGEYIRTGLDYSKWLSNFEEGVSKQKNRRQMRIDFTLTLPGMFEVLNIVNLAERLGVELLAKVVFSFSPDVVMSPLALPREVLDKWVDELLFELNKNVTTIRRPMIDVLNQLKNRPTFEQQWPAEYEMGFIKGRQRIFKLEDIRKDTYTMTDILRERNEVYEWWSK